MASRPPKRAAVLAAVLALAAAGCGEGEEAESQGEDGTVTVYSSLPLQAGPLQPQAAAILAGIERALADRGDEIEGLTVEHRSLDNSSREDAGPAPEREAANARTASQDDSAVAYIGALTFEAAAIAIPILNEGGMVEVSPGAIYGGLTRETPASQPGEPEKYYPTGERNFARLVPIDVDEAEVLAEEMAAADCEDAFLAVEDEVSSNALAALLAARLESRGMPVAGRAALDPEAPGLETLGQEAAAPDPGCAVVLATPGELPEAAYRELGDALPEARLFGAHGACRPVLGEGGAELPDDVAERITCTSYVRELTSYPGADEVAADDPLALYGYEAMQLVLDAIEDGGSDRLAVRQALLSADGRSSVLGEYGLDEHGDTTLDAIAVYQLRDGRLRQARVAEPSG